MSEKPKSRKRNVVNGTVSQIKKEKKLGLDRVGETSSVLSSILRLFKKDNRNGR